MTLSHWRRSLVALRQEIAFYQRVLKHPHTPRLSRWLLGLALAYLLSPIDLVPDWIPLLGQIDDLLIVPLLIYLALRLIPPAVITACRTQSESIDH